MVDPLNCMCPYLTLAFPLQDLLARDEHLHEQLAEEAADLPEIVLAEVGVYHGL